MHSDQNWHRERLWGNVVIQIQTLLEFKHKWGGGEEGLEVFCSIDCDLSHLKQITEQSGSTAEKENVLRQCHRRQER